MEKGEGRLEEGDDDSASTSSSIPRERRPASRGFRSSGMEGEGGRVNGVPRLREVKGEESRSAFEIGGKRFVLGQFVIRYL